MFSKQMLSEGFSQEWNTRMEKNINKKEKKKRTKSKRQKEQYVHSSLFLSFRYLTFFILQKTQAQTSANQIDLLKLSVQKMNREYKSDLQFDNQQYIEALKRFEYNTRSERTREEFDGGSLKVDEICKIFAVKKPTKPKKTTTGRTSEQN